MMVDENRTEGSANKLGSTLQDAVGDLTGDAETKARGKANQAAGTAQNAFGSLMDVANEWSGDVAKMAQGRPLTALLGAVSAGYMFRLLTPTSRR